MNQVLNNEEREQHEDDSDCKGSRLRGARNSLGSLYDYLASLLQIQGSCILQRNMDSPAVDSYKQSVDQVFDNLSEGKGDNGKVVSL